MLWAFYEDKHPLSAEDAIELNQIIRDLGPRHNETLQEALCRKLNDYACRRVDQARREWEASERTPASGPVDSPSVASTTVVSRLDRVTLVDGSQAVTLTTRFVEPPAAADARQELNEVAALVSESGRGSSGRVLDAVKQTLLRLREEVASLLRFRDDAAILLGCNVANILPTIAELQKQKTLLEARLASVREAVLP